MIFPDSKRSSPSLLARQLRLRLVAGEDSDIPKNLHNIVVSIHAIATFQALHDYLRPRVAGLMLNGRFGPYITDGKKNIKVPKDQDPVKLTAKECAELLAKAPARAARKRRTRQTK